MSQKNSELKTKYFAFSFHLIHAIFINFIRAPYYAWKTKLLSVPVSVILISSEFLTLFMAIFYDLWAMIYQIKGSNILSDDFTSMSLILHKEEKPMSYPVLTVDKKDTLFKEILKINSDAKRNLTNEKNLTTLYPYFLSYLNTIIEIEKKSSVHFQMCKHILESVACMMKNQSLRSKKEQNQVHLLYTILVRSHAYSLDLAFNIDKMAHYSHKLKVGILVNDMPKIHYKE